MNYVIDQLYALQQLELQRAKSPEVKQKIEDLRATVLAPVLAHYDRLMARGKKGVAVVRNQVCAECHMHVAIGVVARLMRREDIQLCGSCGRYLWITDEAPAVEPAPEPKPAARKRRSKTPQHAE